MLDGHRLAVVLNAEGTFGILVNVYDCNDSKENKLLLLKSDGCYF